MTPIKKCLILVFISLLAGFFCASAQVIDTITVPVTKAQLYRVPQNPGRNHYLWMADCGTIVSPNGLDSVIILWSNKCGLHTITLIDTTGQSCSNDTILASVMVVGTPLPVELVNFTALLLDQQTAKLDWQTASEINNDYFIIERSLDARNFIPIGTVKGNGNSNEIHNYCLYDKNVDQLTSCHLYYRLKQADNNGSITDLGLKELIICTISKNDATKVWYNQPDNRIYINLIREMQMSPHLLITDMRGKTIASQTIQAAKGASQISLNLFGLAKGIYNVTISDDTGIITKRILKP